MTKNASRRGVLLAETKFWMQGESADSPPSGTFAEGTKVDAVAEFRDDNTVYMFVRIVKPATGQAKSGWVKADKVAILADQDAPPARWRRSGTLLHHDKPWTANAADPYALDRALGASSLVWNPNSGSLDLALEKHPVLLHFAPLAEKPLPNPLNGVRKVPDGVDMEAMSICEGKLYLFDEDKLVAYETAADEPGEVIELPIRAEAHGAIATKSTNGNSSDKSSIEGMVVSRTRFGFEAEERQFGNGPYFYLLDERDFDGTNMVARLYLAVRDGNELRVAKTLATFALDGKDHTAFRLPELFEFRGSLYALKTKAPINDHMRGVYKVVRCNLKTQTLEECCDFTDYARELERDGVKTGSESDRKVRRYDSNFEGAAVTPEGRLILTADNENYPDGNDAPPRSLQEGRHATPIIVLEVEP